MWICFCLYNAIWGEKDSFYLGFVFLIFVEMSEQHLYKDFVNGRMKSFYDEFYPTLLIYASRILGEEFSFLSEDIVQDTIYKTYLERNRLHSESSLKSYLYTSVHNSAVSVLRRAGSRNRYLNQLETASDDLSNSIIEQETLRRLFVAIEKLPQPYREVIELSFGDGLRNAEIAEILGISVSAVKQRKSKLLLLLQRMVADGSDSALLLLPFFVSLH